MIICKTIIGYGLPNRADTSGIHGSPAGWDELNLAKENAGIPTEPLFYITDEILAHFREQIAVGAELQKEWNELYTCYKEKYPDLAKEFERRNARILPENWDENLPVFEPDKKGLATRVASWHTIQKIADALPEVVGEVPTSRQATTPGWMLIPHLDQNNAMEGIFITVYVRLLWQQSETVYLCMAE